MMKKMTQKMIALILFMGMAIGPVLAQTTEYTWDTYKMKFSVPSSFTVDQNDAKVFDAGNSDMHLSIYPRKGENLSAEGMITSLDSWVTDNNVTGKSEMNVITTELNGYWGVYQEGTANGWPVFLALLVDPDYPDISLYVWISYRQANLDAAVDMLMSFKPM